MLIFLVAGIKCFSCNSHYDRNCGDPFSNYTTELVNCEQVSNCQTMIVNTLTRLLGTQPCAACLMMLYFRRTTA